MNLDRRKNADLLFHAIQWAIQDRQSYAQCWGNGSLEQKDALKDIASLRRLSCQLFGTDKTMLDDQLAGSRPMTLQEIRKVYLTE